MRLTVVGCAPAYTSLPGRAASGYLVEHDGTRLMLDFGQGVFPELWRYTSPADVSAVAISHLHADHNVDLIPLRHWVRFENRGYGPSLHAPLQLRQRFADFQADPDFLADFHGDALAPGSFAVGDLRIDAGRVTHIPDSFAFRVSAAGGGPGLVYSGDCSVADDLLPLMRAGDVLLCEAAFGRGPKVAPIHLTATEAGEAAARGGAGRLVLTHVLDDHAGEALAGTAQAVFGGSVEVARPGLEIDIR